MCVPTSQSISPFWVDRENRYHATLKSIEPAPESIKNDSSFSSTTTTNSSSNSSSSSTSNSAIYYNGIFHVPNPDHRLGTYMTAEVQIVLGEARNVLTIPAAALGAAHDGTYAVQLLAPDGSVITRQITVGLNNKITAEVRSGLQEGERVVTGQKSAEAPTSRMPGPPPMGL